MAEDREKKDKVAPVEQGSPGRQAAARDFDELLRLTYENSPLGMGFISLDGVLMDCNDALAAVIGSPREALIGSRMKAGIIDEGIAVAIAKAFSGATGVFEGEYSAAGKGTITLRTIHAPLYSPDGEMKGVLFVAEDVSDRKRMEDRLRESERRYKAIVDSQAEFVVRYLPGGILTFLNDTLCRYLGLRSEDLLGKSYYPFMHPDDRGAFIKKIEALDKEHPSMIAEARVVLPDGRETWHRWSHHAIFDDRGRPVEYQSTGRDVTEIREAEERLRESEEKFSKIFKQAPLLVTLSEVDTGRFLDVNEKFLEISGFTRDEVIGRTVIDLGWISEDDRALLLQAIREQGHVSGMELSLRRKDGNPVVCLYNGELIIVQGKEHLLSIAQDITGLKNAEERIKESERKYRNLFESVTDGVFICDLGGTIIDANTAAYQRLGYTKEELLAMSVSQLDAPEFAPRVPERFRQIHKQGVAMFESGHRRKDGSVMPVEVNARMLDFEGRLVILSAVRDITERKGAEETLRKSERRTRSIIESIPVGMHMYHLEPDGRLVFMGANQAADRILGVDNKQFFGMTVEEAFPALKATDVPQRYRDVARSGKAWQTESVEYHENAISGAFEVHAFQIAPNSMVAAFEDITQRKRAEEALQKSERMLQTIIEAEPECVKVLDENACLIMMNRAGLDMLQVASLEEVKGQCVCPMVTSEYRPAFLDLTKRVFHGESGNLVFEMVGAKGRRLWLETHAVPLRNEKDEIVALLGVTRDITERKRAEEELREKESRYRTLFEAANDGIFIQDSRGFTDCNRRGAEMYGLTQEEIIGHSPAEFAPERQPDGRLSAEFAAEKTRAALSGAPQVFEWQPLRADGTPFDVEVTLSRLELGGSVYLQAIVRDITERKRVGKALRESEERYRTIFEGAAEGVALADVATHKLLYVNPAFCEMYGYTKDEAASLAVEDLHPRPAVPRAVAEFEAQARGEKVLAPDLPCIRKDGSVFYADVKTTKIGLGGTPAVVGFFTDITERKLAEERSGKYSRDLQRLLLISREMTATTDIAGLYRASVQTAVDLLGFDFSTIMVLSEDQAGLTVMDTVGFPQTMVGTYSLVDGQGLSTYVVRNRRPDAVLDFLTESRFEVPDIVRERGIRSALCVPMMLGERVFGVLIGHTLVQREFSPEETAIYENIGNEAAIAIRNAINLNELARSEAKLRNITSNIAEGLYVLDETGRITFMNEEAKRLLGWSVEELNERGAHQLVHFRKADGTPLPLDECPMHGIISRRARFSSNDEVFVRKDGTVFPVSVVCSPIIEEGGKIASVVAFRDITGTKRLEQELLKIQKLESVGTLAGGIAHDFNNLLQGVFGYISVAKLSLDQRERAAALLEQAERALHQSVNLTTQLLTFSKGGKPVKKRVALGPVIENGVRFALSGSQLTHRIDLAQDLLPVEADEGQLGQVIHNIVLNADQAMPLGGRIEVQARNVPASSPELPPGLTRADHVRIDIRDHGAGIPAEYLPRIFDPYFTTKEKGSGLGLATSYAIVRNHGGMITVSSEPAKGATFSIFLPASHAAPERQTPGEAPAGMRRAKVLVMDDEEIVRNVSVELLHELGHDVECAEHGAAAIDAYRKAQDAGRPFDIVILDLTIRDGMGGMETLHKLRELDPQVKAVVSSGYSDEEIVSDFRNRGFSAFLKKPYDLSALRDILRSLLA